MKLVEIRKECKRRTNVPQNITYVAETLASYMGVPTEELVKHARENTERFFGIGK